MSNDIRENAIVKLAIDAVKGIEGNKSEVDAAKEIEMFNSIINGNKANFESEEDYKKALGLYQTNPVDTTEAMKNTPKTPAERVQTTFNDEFKKALKEGSHNQEEIVLRLEKSIDEMTDKKERKAAKEALKALEETVIKRNAQAYVEEAIATVHETEKDKEYAIKDVAVQYLKDHKMWDKYTEKEISRKNLFKKDSFGEAYIEKQQIKNRVAKKKVQSFNEIKKKLNKGKNDLGLFGPLRQAGLIKKAADGKKYDLTALSDVILEYTGKDYTLSYADKETKNHSELVNLKAELNRILHEKGIEVDLSKREVKILAELCGFEVQGVDLGKVAKGTLIGTVVNGIVGGIAAATNPNQDVLVEGDSVEHNLNLTLNGNFSPEDLGGLPEGFELTQTAAGIVIKVHQLIQYPDVLIKISKHVGETALKSAIAGAICGALASLKPDGEISVESPYTNDDYSTYIGRLKEKEENPYAPIFVMLASLFLDDSGNWNRDEYNKFLESLGGKEGIINERELLGEVQALQRKLKTQDDDETSCDETSENCSASVTLQAGEPTVEIEDKTHTHFRNAGDTWKGIVEAYYPGLIEKCGGLWGKNGAIKALQRELCTDENRNFNKAKFQELISATDLPKEMKMPLKVNGIDRQINGVKAGEFTEAKGDEIKKALDKVGRDEKVSISKVGPGTYVATDNCDSSQKAVGNTKEEALKKLKEKTGKTYNNEAELLKN